MRETHLENTTCWSNIQNTSLLEQSANYNVLCQVKLCPHLSVKTFAFQDDYANVLLGRCQKSSKSLWLAGTHCSLVRYICAKCFVLKSPYKGLRNIQSHAVSMCIDRLSWALSSVTTIVLFISQC